CGKCEQSSPKSTVNSSFSPPDDNHAKKKRIRCRRKDADYATRKDKSNAEIAALEKELDDFKRLVAYFEHNYSHLSFELTSLKKENSILQSLQSQIRPSPEDFSLIS
ncbi:9479_t:CDS:1, partial [Gigaspora margarita]